MNSPGFKRRKYLVHFSMQSKYILMSVLPAFLISIFCVNMLFSSGEMIFKKEREKLFKKAVEVNTTVDRTILWLQKEQQSKELAKQMGGVLRQLIELENTFKISYLTAIQKWAAFKSLVLISVILALFGVALISLLYSHRIAGPLLRLHRYIEMLASGQDIPSVRFRNYDEFKEVADSLEKLRLFLKQKK